MWPQELDVAKYLQIIKVQPIATNFTLRQETAEQKEVKVIVGVASDRLCDRQTLVDFCFGELVHSDETLWPYSH